MNVNDLKRSRFLTQREIEKPILVTIVSYKEYNVAMEGAEPDERWTLSFRELEKPLVLNSTNGQIIAAIVGSEEAENWIGHKIVLYVDPNVSFGSKLVGGIRVRAPKSKPIPKTEPLLAKPKVNHAESDKLAEELAASNKQIEELTTDETAEDDIPF